MNWTSHRAGLAAGAVIFILTAAQTSQAANAPDCPNGGVVRFGVEPYDTSAKLVPIYDHIGKVLGDKLGCEVKVYVTTNYNAEIEAMRAGKLEIGEFGPLGYVLAHQVAKAEAVAAFGNKEGKPDSYWASLVTWPGSGIKTVAEIRGHSFAFSDPGLDLGPSVPGLWPAQGRHRSGQGHQADLRRQPHLLVRGAVQPQGRCRRAEQRAARIGHAARPLQGRRRGLPVEVRSDPDRSDHRARRSAGRLQGTPGHGAADARPVRAAGGRPQDHGPGRHRFVPQTDGAYDGIRDLVKTLNIDLEKLS